MTKARDNATQGGLVLLSETTFSAASTITIDNCFTSTYKSYYIALEPFGCSSYSASLYFRFRIGSGSPSNYTSGYDGSCVYGNYNSTTVGNFGAGNTDKFLFAYDAGGNGTSANSSGGHMFIRNVGLSSSYPVVNGQYFGNSWGSNFNMENRNLQNYTGFSIYASTGNVNGTIKIYAYK